MRCAYARTMTKKKKNYEGNDVSVRFLIFENGKKKREKASLIFFLEKNYHRTDTFDRSFSLTITWFISFFFFLIFFFTLHKKMQKKRKKRKERKGRKEKKWKERKKNLWKIYRPISSKSNLQRLYTRSIFSFMHAYIRYIDTRTRFIYRMEIQGKIDVPISETKKMHSVLNENG